MDTNIILKIIEILIIPISIGIVGTIISSKIDSKKNWETKWSENFFQLFQDYNKAVEDYLNTLFNYAEFCKKGTQKAEDETPFIAQLHQISADIQRKEFGLRTQLCFAPKTSKEIMALTQKILEQINAIAQTKRTNIDAIHATLIELNKKARIAHGEMLRLKNKCV